jgi:hypothetical protein
MGVWERSPAGAAIAARNEGLLASFSEALPDVEPADNVGSPYCIRRYEVDPGLGGREGLAVARAELARRGLRLLLDYVPNHVAPDHPWTVEHPERFVHDESGEIALGRDPFFPPWPDVVQLNAFDEGMRQATIGTLMSIGDQCDGVRCDMAMLLLNDVFARTWGDLAGPRPEREFWPDIIDAVHARHPGMLFIAEAYWDLEPVLLDQGFDHCYDKRLYDRLEHEGGDSVRAHLWADPDYQRGLVRFTENHDEPRAARAFGDRSRVAAVTVATLPGATLWHEGQLEGRRTRIPVFLRRRPDEPPDDELRAFLTALIAAAPHERTGDWRQLDVHGWADNDTRRNLVAWAWDRHAVVVNLSDQRSQGRIWLPWDLGAGSVHLTDVLADDVYERDATDLATNGLYVELEPWSWHILRHE